MSLEDGRSRDERDPHNGPTPYRRGREERDAPQTIPTPPTLHTPPGCSLDTCKVTCPDLPHPPEPSAAAELVVAAMSRCAGTRILALIPGHHTLSPHKVRPSGEMRGDPGDLGATGCPVPAPGTGSRDSPSFFSMRRRGHRDRCRQPLPSSCPPLPPHPPPRHLRGHTHHLPFPRVLLCQRFYRLAGDLIEAAVDDRRQ